MKINFTHILLSLFILSCSSPEKLLQKGNYDATD